MTYIRVSSLSTLPISAAVTFALFLVMTLMVAGDGLVNLDKVQERQITILTELPKEPLKILERELVKPDPVTIPDEVPLINDETFDITDRDFRITPPKPAAKYKPTGPNFGQQADGEYMPLVRVQPIYPRRAQEHGIEGYVIVELTVGADGSVPPDSIRIVEAEPKGYFEGAAIKAAKKFKYKPKIVNGKGQVVTGVSYRFSFNFGD